MTTHQDTSKKVSYWSWLFPVLLLALIAGLCAPIQIYLNNYSTFQVKLVQMIPVFLVTFIVILAVGTGIGLLILNWRWVKQKLGIYKYVLIGGLVALVFVICVNNKAPVPTLLCTGLLMGMLIRNMEQGLLVLKWEQKYKYLIYGIALVAGIAAFIQNKYPLLTVFVWGAVLGMVLNKKDSPINVYTDIVFGLALAFFAQLLLCNTGLETLTNSQPNWNNQSTGAVLSLHLWGLSLILPSVLRLIDVKVLRQVKQWGSAVLGAGAVIAVVAFVAKADLPPIRVVTKDSEFTLSTNENVVVFLVDSLDAKYAEDYMLAEDILPKTKKKKKKEKTGLDESRTNTLLDDFTYFDNVVSGAWNNSVSVPMLLTGERFSVNPDRDPNYNWEMYSKDRERYYEEAYAQSSLFSDLIENGYSIRFYSNTSLVQGMDVEQIDNVRTDIAFRQKSFGTSLGNMLRLTAYYAMPYQAKHAFWISSNDIASNTEMATPDVQNYNVWDATYYKDYTNEGLTLVEDGKTFVIYHLRGAVAPYRMNEECKQVNEADTSLEQQVAGVFRMIGEYIEEMKAKGVYDNSTIIIAGTNGDLELGQNPAVFIKRKHDSGTLVRNSRPLTFANLRSSFVDGIVKKPLPKYGYNMFNQPKDEAPALREHLADQSKWKQVYPWDNSPRWRTFMIMNKARGTKYILKTVETDPYPVVLNEWMSLCGYRDMTDRIQIRGLSTNDGAYRWTSGQNVTMGFALEEPRENVLFRMDYSDTFNGDQRVLAYVNNHPVYDEIASGASSIRFSIPMEYAPDGIYNIVLKLPNVVSPVSLGISDDTRKLGLQVIGCGLYADSDENLLYP